MLALSLAHYASFIVYIYCLGEEASAAAGVYGAVLLLSGSNDLFTAAKRGPLFISIKIQYCSQTYVDTKE